jgi:exodeoxyribonuclease V alpha subunit
VEGGGLDLARLTRRMGPARTLHGLLGARPGTRQLRHLLGTAQQLFVATILVYLHQIN